MRPKTVAGWLGLPIRWRVGPWLVLIVLGLAFAGCAHDSREITPTTLGTDLKRMPRGKMTPFAWPGQSIVEAKPRPFEGAMTDPEAALASGPAEGR